MSVLFFDKAEDCRAVREAFSSLSHCGGGRGGDRVFLFDSGRADSEAGTSSV